VRLGPHQSHRHDELRLAGSIGSSRCLVEVFPHARLRASCAQNAEQVQLKITADQGDAGIGEQLGTKYHRIVPAASPLKDSRPLAPQATGAGGQIVLVAISDAVDEVWLGFSIISLFGTSGKDVRESAACLVLKSGRNRDLQCAAHIWVPVPADAGNRAALRVERVAHHAERSQGLGDGDGPLAQVKRRLFLAVHHPLTGEAGNGRCQLDRWS
jgi:hypothetical protein